MNLSSSSVLLENYCASHSRSSSLSSIDSIADTELPSSSRINEQPSNSGPQFDKSGCVADVTDKCWYWGSANKEIISAALENKQDGTFAVRDASTNGQFTLTLRVAGANKLIKILVENDKCGFTRDTFDFDSISSLVQFYRTCSLRDFNERLDMCLLYPLPSPDFVAREQNEANTSSKFSQMHRINLLKCRLEGFHAEYDRVSRRYDSLFSQMNISGDEFQRKKQTTAAYCEALKIFQRKIVELKRMEIEDGLSERDREALRANIELQQERMEEIGKAQELVNTALQNIGQTLSNLNGELEEHKPLLLKLYRKRDKCRDKILSLPKQQNTTHAQLDRQLEAVSLALDSEPVILSVFLIRAHFPMPEWDCERWLWHRGATKEQAVNILLKLLPNLKQKDGVFLIRPSSSHPGFYAMEISKDGNVHSCLIEYRDPRTSPEHCGVDFVRYYANTSLKEHNVMLDTTLKTPALELKRKQRESCSEENDETLPAQID
uniref:SH2 domain-containing protein n=1 Tax=Globodera rostochiensis TaxID=31243 RepID=A0A914I7A4_GLORO